MKKLIFLLFIFTSISFGEEWGNKIFTDSINPDTLAQRWVEAGAKRMPIRIRFNHPEFGPEFPDFDPEDRAAALDEWYSLKAADRAVWMKANVTLLDTVVKKANLKSRNYNIMTAYSEDCIIITADHLPHDYSGCQDNAEEGVEFKPYDFAQEYDGQHADSNNVYEGSIHPNSPILYATILIEGYKETLDYLWSLDTISWISIGDVEMAEDRPLSNGIPERARIKGNSTKKVYTNGKVNLHYGGKKYLTNGTPVN